MIKWGDSKTITSKSFICGFCNNIIASDQGYIGWEYLRAANQYKETEYIYICNHCKKPTYFNYKNEQLPSSKYGKSFFDLPDKVNHIYEEAKNCFAVNAYTATIMLCRRLISDICIDLGAKAGLNFEEYVNYLDNQNYIPTGSKEWVDIIRKLGNKVTHKEYIGTNNDAKQCIIFSEMIITLNYEFKAKTTEEKK
jgi:hypothetical protein